MMKRAKAIETRQQKAVEQKSALLKNAETADALKIRPLEYRADTLVSFSDVAAIYDGSPVCRPVSFKIRRKERVMIDGRNGSGKSSLLKLLLYDSAGHTGTVSAGSGLRGCRVGPEKPGRRSERRIRSMLQIFVDASAVI